MMISDCTLVLATGQAQKEKLFHHELLLVTIRSSS